VEGKPLGCVLLFFESYLLILNEIIPKNYNLGRYSKGIVFDDKKENRLFIFRLSEIEKLNI
jgi:hypothetical protein